MKQLHNIFIQFRIQSKIALCRPFITDNLPSGLRIIILLLVLSMSVPVYAQGYLHRSGRYIYDGSGKEVILRGIGTGNWMLQEGYMMQTSEVAGSQHEFRAKLEAIIGEEKTAAFYEEWLTSHFGRADVDSMKSWGFNSVRVAMHYIWFTPPVGEEPVAGEITWTEKGFALIDSLLDWCGDNEMYLILDLHGAPGGQGKDSNISDYDPSKPSLWESQANKDKTIALWKKLAERYCNEPWIGGYDLINETNWTFPEGNNSKLRELMVNITKAIREVDKNHLIFIEGNGFANDFSGLTPPWDSNMAYSFHKYWNYNTTESINFALNLRNSYNIPIWLGETGENSNVWFTSLIELCEKNRIGWSWWPVKKPGINNPLSVSVNESYTRLVNYWKGQASNPGADAAFEAVMQFARNHRIENCEFRKDVVDAMIRQPHTVETIPFSRVQAGEPVFAVNYDLGRNGFAYFDNDTADFHGSTGEFINWNQGWSYRNDGVDIEKCTDIPISNGYNVGWTGDQEWMEYTISIDSTAAYTFNIRSASGSGGSRILLKLDGTPITPVISLPATGGWQKWQTTIFKSVILPRGNQKIRFVFEKGGSNLNYFSFTDPMSSQTVPFNLIFTESAADGNSILLTFNKPVTSHQEEILPGDFTVTCDNIPVRVTSVGNGGDTGLTLVLHLSETLYYGGVIRLFYLGNDIHSAGQPVESIANVAVINRLPVRFTLPGRIQSEDFAVNNGLVSEKCSDTGGGWDMGYASPGDYLDYRVYVPEAGKYIFSFRVATIRAASQLIIMAGEDNSFTSLDTLNITSTGGWQTWKTLSTELHLPKGRYMLRMFVKSGEFNTNWFQADYGTSVKSNLRPPALVCYPNPAKSFTVLKMPDDGTSNEEITVFNGIGQPVKKFWSEREEEVVIDTSGLPGGIYFVEVRNPALIYPLIRLIIP